MQKTGTTGDGKSAVTTLDVKSRTKKKIHPVQAGTTFQPEHCHSTAQAIFTQHSR